MIESLSIFGFQKHIRRRIQFGQFVTTFVGISDAGKSTIFRALRWVCLNDFDGPSDQLIHWDAQFAKVVLVVDGHTIVRKRVRKGSQNSYTLDGKVFRAIKSDVPPAIAKILNVSEINFQSQDDPRFWLSLPPAQLSRELNRIINLETIDSTLATLSTQSHRAKAEARVCASRLSASLEQKAGLAWVPSVAKELTRLEGLKATIDAETPRIALLSKLIDDASQSRQALRRSETLRQSGTAAVEAGAIARRDAKDVKRLKNLIDELDSVEISDPRKLIEDAARLDELFETARRDEADATKLTKLLGDIFISEERQCEILSLLEEKQTSLSKLPIGPICPVCGRPSRKIQSSRSSAPISTSQRRRRSPAASSPTGI